MKRAIIIIIILAIVIGVGVAGFFFLTPKPYSVAEDESLELVEIKTDTIIASVEAAGRLEAIETVNLRFEIPGKVTKIHVPVGARVEAGVLLAELDSNSLVESVRLAEIDLANAETQLKKLLEPPSQADINAAQTALVSAQAGLESILTDPNELDIKAAQLSLDSARANLQRLLRDPNPNSVTVAAASLRKSEIALAQAQGAYDQVAYDSRSISFQGAALEQATIDYETALANYNLAIKDPESADILAAQGQIASAEAALQRLLDPSTSAQIASAEAQIAQAEATLQKLLDGPSDLDIASSESAVESAQIRLEQARRNLEKTRLFSPIAGTVTAINIKENEEGQLGSLAAISLADLSTYKLKVEIDEIDINRIAPAQPVIVTLDSIPDEEYTGIVDQVAVEPVAASAAGGIVAYEVTVLINSEEAPFKIGMNVNATIETGRLEDIVVIENRAVQIDRETGAIYVEKVIDDQTVQRIEITLGEQGITVSQVLSGLEAGDKIAIRERSRRDQLRQAIQE